MSTLAPHASALGETWRAFAFCDRIDHAIEHTQHETLGGGIFNACAHQPLVVRPLRIYVSSSRTDTEGGLCQWKLRVWAGRAEGGPPLPLARFFSLVHVDVASSPTVTVEWTAPSGAAAAAAQTAMARTTGTAPAAAAPAAAASPLGFELCRTTNRAAEAGGAEGGAASDFTATVTLRLRQPAKSLVASDPVAPNARVCPSAALAAAIGLTADAPVAYSTVEEALWLVIKEKRLLELTQRGAVASVRFSGYTELASALGVPAETRALPINELPKYLHKRLSLCARTLHQGHHHRRHYHRPLKTHMDMRTHRACACRMRAQTHRRLHPRPPQNNTRPLVPPMPGAARWRSASASPPLLLSRYRPFPSPPPSPPPPPSLALH